MIKVKYRVKTHQDFQKIIHFRKIQKDSSFIIYFQNNILGYTRFGISVSKKRGNAVKRNLIKRQIRHMIKDISNFKEPLDFVIIVRDGYDVKQFEKMKNNLENLLKRTRRAFNED